jgi:hypothetical protein
VSSTTNTIIVLNGGETMNGVFTNTKKSIDFFLNCFSFLNAEQDPIRKYVEVEFRPNDREWAYEQVKADIDRKKYKSA